MSDSSETPNPDPVLDLAATEHFQKGRCLNATGETVQIATVTDDAAAIGHIGSGTYWVKAPDGAIVRLRLERVVFSEKLSDHIISLPVLRRHGWDFSLRTGILTSPDGREFQAHTGPDGLLHLRVMKEAQRDKIKNSQTTLPPRLRVPATNLTDNGLVYLSRVDTRSDRQRVGIQLLHLRLGHYAENKILESLKLGADFGPAGKEALKAGRNAIGRSLECQGCDKMARRPSKSRVERRQVAVGEIAHLDFKTGLHLGFGNQKYALDIVDQTSRYGMALALKKKSDISAAFKIYVADAKSHGHTVKAVRCDNEKVLKYGKFMETLQGLGIRSEPTPPYDPRAGGVHERFVGDVWEHTMKTMLNAKHVPDKCWPCVMKTIALIRNNLKHSSTQRIPAIDWRGRPQRLSNMRAIGSAIYATTPARERDAHKPHSKRYVFVGLRDEYTLWLYDKTNGIVVERGNITASIELFNQLNAVVESDSDPTDNDDDDDNATAAETAATQELATRPANPTKITRQNKTRLEPISSVDALEIYSSGSQLIGTAWVTQTLDDGTTRSHWVYLVGLLELMPQLWEQVTSIKTDDTRLFQTVIDNRWPDWQGFTVGLDTAADTIYIAFSDGTFSEQRIIDTVWQPHAVEGGGDADTEKKQATDKKAKGGRKTGGRKKDNRTAKGGVEKNKQRSPRNATVLKTATKAVIRFDRPVTVAKLLKTTITRPEDAIANPIMTLENRHNCFVPANDAELERMPHGTLYALLKEAKHTEAENLLHQTVYKWVRMSSVPSGKKLTKSRTVFALKWDDITGHLEKAKARIVAKGFTQIYGIDFQETYASTPKLSTSRLFIMLMVKWKLKWSEFDVTAAYLHADLEEEIYLEPPPGITRTTANGERMIWRLLKSLYGLKQAGRNWMRTFFRHLRELGLNQSRADTSLWMSKATKGKIDLILFVHTDDGKAGYRKSATYQRFLSELKQRVNIGSESDSPTRIFNIQVDRLNQGAIMLHQAKYVEDMMNQHKIEANARHTTPMASDFRMHLAPPAEKGNAPRELTAKFMSLLACLLWVARCTRWEIQAALITLSKASCNPDETHLKALRRVAQYVYNTRSKGIKYTRAETTRDSLEMNVFSDANHGTAPDGRSMHGVIILIDGAIIDWVCKHQPYVTLSSGEAESVALATAGANTRYWQMLIKEFIGQRPDATIRVDANVALQFMTEPRHESKMKHVEHKILFVREHVEAKYYDVQKVPGEDNPADILTKPLAKDKLEYLYGIVQPRLFQGGASTDSDQDLSDSTRSQKRRRLNGTDKDKR